MVRASFRLQIDVYNALAPTVVLSVSFMWYKVKTHVIRLGVIEGTKARAQVAF